MTAEANDQARAIFERSIELDPAFAPAYAGLSLAYGYDIGIASAWQSQNFAYSPAQWRGRLTPKSSSLQPTDASNAPAAEAGR